MMPLELIEARQSELDRIIDWMVDGDPAAFLQYYHERYTELDSMRPGDA
jgi:plasmid stabilization system protein ParE